MTTIYIDEDDMFMVKRDESTGDLFLSVVVGGIGMYEVEREMTVEMVEQFNRNPRELLGIVKQIRLAR